MKQRIITAMVGLVLLSACMLFFNTIFFNIIIAIIALIAVFEVLAAANLIKYRLLCLICVLITASTPFLTTHISDLTAIIYMCLVFLTFLILIAHHNTLSFKDAFMAIFYSFVLGFSFSTFVYIRDSYDLSVGLMYIILMLGGAWLSDTGAYFIGGIYGNKKLAPKISPKKTVEGAIGGVITCVVCFLIIGGIFQIIWDNNPQNNLKVDFLLLGITGFILSILSIIGDLSASVIKRQCGIKDFGKIFPGHGGVLDRFDSVVFTAPALWVIVTYFNIVK